MNIKNVSKVLISTALSVGLCFGVAATANASVSRIYYAVSGGSIEGGYYRGSYNVSKTKSVISIYSVSSYSYCVAVQDGHNNKINASAPNQYCTYNDTGSSASTDNDFVFYKID